MTALRYVFSYFVVIIFLSSCESTPRPKSLDQTDDWRFVGRIQYIADERGVLSTHWTYIDGYHDIELSGPFRLGLTRLAGDSTLLIISNREGTVSGPAQELMIQNLGWYIPLEVLPFWMQGLPYYQNTRLSTDNSGQRFNELGWEIWASDFRDINGTARPYRLQLKHQDYEINIRISDWDQH